MAILSNEFTSALPTNAASLVPSMVGTVISYDSETTRVNKNVTPPKSTQILITKLDGTRVVELPAGAFNSLFFLLKGGKVETISEATIGMIGKTTKSVMEAIDTQPTWAGAVQGRDGLLDASTGEFSFGSYTIAGYRIKTTYNGQPSYKLSAYVDYDDARLNAATTGIKMNYDLVKLSGIKQTIPTGFLDHLTYEFLLIPIN